ncbi:hypothetical protein [Acinetobacter sp. WCHA39]|uniref:hypothetical protein n=1 Tax=Acinetobacter sp. WCHA39 TaxID=2004648 RepID=UPI000B3C6E79|nr:hypothetical protein [Acinetobacter sp. WCHA39]
MNKNELLESTNLLKKLSLSWEVLIEYCLFPNLVNKVVVGVAGRSDIDRSKFISELLGEQQDAYVTEAIHSCYFLHDNKSQTLELLNSQLIQCPKFRWDNIVIKKINGYEEDNLLTVGVKLNFSEFIIWFISDFEYMESDILFLNSLNYEIYKYIVVNENNLNDAKKIILKLEMKNIQILLNSNKRENGFVSEIKGKIKSWNDMPNTLILIDGFKFVFGELNNFIEDKDVILLTQKKFFRVLQKILSKLRKGEQQAFKRQEEDILKNTMSSIASFQEADHDCEIKRAVEYKDNNTYFEEGSKLKISLQDKDIVNKYNYELLLNNCKELPFYYAGLECLVYHKDITKVMVEKLEDESEINYCKFQDDLYLRSNRQPIQLSLAIDKLNQKLKAASQNKVNVQDMVGNSRNCVISGFDEPLVRVIGAEEKIRKDIAEFIGESFNDQVVGISLSHQFNTKFLSKKINRKKWDEFSSLAHNVAGDTSLLGVRQLLEFAMIFFDKQSYNDLYKIYNSAVCNALTCSLECNIKNISILDDWEYVENLIKKYEVNQPYIVGRINTNLAAGLPSLIFSENDKIDMLRNYLFLPISKNEFTVASPLHYATINKSVRPELYGAIYKILTTNIPPEWYKALTTIVTLENESLTVFYNRDLINDSGFYIFKPIDC